MSGLVGMIWMFFPEMGIRPVVISSLSSPCRSRTSESGYAAKMRSSAGAQSGWPSRM